ncbi:hypothetical protein [Croceimicrobium hydrocarbonivorans]|uniref:Uncharacterized protein n=1 Tax=Croceimicrobium hydrocarbonivorans TaxID=2761580 RepID=A0A7H0VB83_9FLAO|nr:hypothetical protein [Croceimicrobium hydrocarbonivorans]QNR22981.1 hypothetical protein H4K34_11385 [Croceimicrobium hydrocarbonivorans]
MHKKENTLFNIVVHENWLYDAVPVLSVCMPIRKMHHTYHIALKALCNQDSDVPWELLIFADHDSITEIALLHILSFYEKLAAAD